jgi:hypothetical protein
MKLNIGYTYFNVNAPIPIYKPRLPLIYQYNINKNLLIIKRKS